MKRLCAVAVFAVLSVSLPAYSSEPDVIAIPKIMRDGRVIDVWHRKGLMPEDTKTRGFPLKPEKLLLKSGTIRREGAMPLTCDIIFERDVPVMLRDGVVIYADVFRPNDDEKHPAIMAWSPYGKEIGGQHLDDVPGRSGVPLNATSGLEKFEAPDPAYWVKHGYVIINPDSRGANNSGGYLNYWGSENSRDGYDVIEWAASQDWCSGKIAMSGNSWLAVSQWFIAGERPPHLTAIAPWEGFSDHFRETSHRGGIPTPAFPEIIFQTFASRTLIEDQPRMIITHTLIDSYWNDKIPMLENIDIPAYVVASYTNPVHTLGTFEGFNRISSREKWLRVHDTNEWQDYYTPENVEDLRRFFDHYMKGIDNGWENTPRVRVSVLDPGHENIVNREESSFPIERTKYTKLYLSKGGKLSLAPQASSDKISYKTDSENSSVNFVMTFNEDTELTGYMKLHMFVEADGADDIDLSLTVMKIDSDGQPMKDTKSGQVIQASGQLRVSHRELDAELSTEYNPVLKSDHEDLLKEGEIAEVNVGIWPMGMIYHKGESLRLSISAWKPVDGGVPVFGSAVISVPSEGYTFEPGSEPSMIVVGGYKGGLKDSSVTVKTPESRNKGTHIIHFGGEYDSYLLVPVIPEK